MKTKKLLLSLLVLFSLIQAKADVIINQTNFPDENFRNYLKSKLCNDDGVVYGKDGVLTDAEIAVIKQMYVTNKQISSLKGIEFFTELTELYCDNNLLSSLDVSNNTALTSLGCSNNRLTSLNVSKNTALRYLSCDRNNLTSLVLSDNVSLTSLSCDNNQLTTLDVSNCTALTSLFCSSNQLNTIDVSKNTALITLACSSNQLITLDISKNTALTDLFCNNNQLTSLDVSKNTKLTVFDGYSNQIKSEGMDLLVKSLPARELGMQDKNWKIISTQNEGNEITSNQVKAARLKGWLPMLYDGTKWSEYPIGIEINETNFPDANFRNYLKAQSYGKDGVITDTEIADIWSMDVANLQISNLNGIEYFIELRTLYCQNNQLTLLDISNNNKLSDLYCHNNRLTILDISKNINIQSLYCDNNLLTALDVSHNTKLVFLVCHNNQLTTLDVSNNEKLVVLHCYSNQIKGIAMDDFINSLRTCNNCPLQIINSINEGNVMTTSQVAAAKAKGWKPQYYDGNTWLEYGGIIEINETNFPDDNFRKYLIAQSYGSDGVITDEEIACITKIDVTERDISNLIGIEFFTALTSLSCAKNQLTSLDLSKNTELTSLSCYRNQLTSLDLSKNTALISLHCYRNQLKSLDLPNTTTLTYLDCRENQLTSLNISKNTALTELKCHSNQLTSLDVSKNIALEQLECYNNQLTLLDVSKNTALTKLDCNHNLLKSLSVSIASMSKLYCDCNQLASLDVSKCTALTSLSCSNNQLTSLDVSKNNALKDFECYSNQIKGEAMDALIESLPTQEDRKLRIINNENEGNVMTTSQVAAAKAKGWIPYYYNYGWIVYAGSIEGIEINETNFPDERFRSYLKGQSYGIDGVLTDAEIASITSMNVNRKNISDLKGIEIFSALTSLSCSNNQLTSLDISKNTELTILWCNYNQLTSLDISKNTLLTELYCYDNQITSLDVSKNTALTRLGCDNNQLSSLDVSKNTKLTFLYCGNRQLTSLDVSNNTALETLYCNDSQLTSLDVSKNTELTKLYCQQNRLTSLDVSKNTVLSLLYCYNNQIKDKAMDALVASLPNANNGILQIINNENEGNVMTTIQVADARVKGWIPMCNDGSNWVEYAGRTSGVIEINETNFPDANFRNYLATQTYGKDGVITEEESSLITSINVEGLQISNLKGIEYFAGLSILSCNNNQLTSLDVSNNTALTILDCNNNQLTSLDVSKNTKLIEVWCYYNQLSSLDVTKNTVLTVLGCFCNQLTSLDVSKNTALTKLHCNVNQLTSLDVSNNTALTNLECGTNQLTSLDVSNNTALIELVCNNNQLTSLDVSKNTALIMLFCYSNQLALLDVSKNTALTILYCHHNQLTSLDVSNNTTLTKLGASDNQLTSLDVSKNTALQVFWCSNNLLTSLDVSKNIALNTLYCYSNQIKGEAMDALVASLPTVENGGLYIMFYENEGNVMTTTQVAAAKAKGWIPMYGNGNNYTEYAGSMPKFKLTYMVDGVEYKSSEVEYGSAITPEAYPEKDTYKFSGWSEIPETMPAYDVTITGTFERYFTVGNVVKLVNFTINGNASSSEVELYDQNTDGELNIGDIILVVKWILNHDNSGSSNSRTRSYDMPDLSQYTAVQFDVKTTVDINIREIKLVKGMEQTHQMMYQQKDANTYTVVVYSLSNQLMKPENGGIVEIDTDNGTLGGLIIENVIAALPLGETRSFNGGQMTTNIQQIESDGGSTVVYDLKGNRMNGSRGQRKGVYIVNGKKVIVK